MKWLSLWRQKQGLTQVQLGEKAGIDPNMISRYERETAIPTLENIKKIALGLGITIDELLNSPRDDKAEIVISWDWEDMKKGELKMEDNKFKLILGEDGQIGINGIGRITSLEGIEEFLGRVREQLTVALEAQIKRGAIQPAVQGA